MANTVPILKKCVSRKMKFASDIHAVHEMRIDDKIMSFIRAHLQKNRININAQRIKISLLNHSTENFSFTLDLLDKWIALDWIWVMNFCGHSKLCAALSYTSQNMKEREKGAGGDIGSREKWRLLIWKIIKLVNPSLLSLVRLWQRQESGKDRRCWYPRDERASIWGGGVSWKSISATLSWPRESRLVCARSAA